ncbi:uncharacterized protein TA14350 [Theileria annulata]|uniref:FPL domain-containing protein n=1 Tax=Theileria annulata TaxID=5874 RepID=Q4UF04_THEAN|nr:uncharacterized protein TA14350 [Theileria annulata]CAI74335.1 hypothetical protein, conserved [Theileria annulata]|eukprot:XP_952067.1 hypothetical protein, conserved [Theileria annulata]
MAKSNQSDPRNLISEQESINLNKFKYLHKNVLNKESSRIASSIQVVDALKQLAEYLIWEDRTDQDYIFEYFCEENIMDYLTGVLCRSTSRTVRIQLIQTISMLIHNIGKKKTLYYMLSNNYLNELISVPEIYSGGDISSWTVSLLKTISSILDKSTIKFFFLQKNETFPLLDKSLLFLSSHDSMKRAHFMTIILNIFKVNDKDVNEYIVNKSEILLRLVLYLKYCWFRLNRYHNKYKSFSPNILSESNDVLCFIEELMDLEIEIINQKIVYLMFVICFIPLIKRLAKVDVNTEKLLVDIGSPPNYSDLYNKLSNAIGLSFFYINNKTLLFNTNSADTTPNVNPQNQCSPSTTSSKPPLNKLNRNESDVVEENKTEKNEKTGWLRDYELNSFDIPNDSDLDKEDVVINDVIYNILVNVIINSKRKEFVNPLTTLLFSPFIPLDLLYTITGKSSDETSRPEPNDADSPQVSSIITTPRNYNPEEETFEYKSYKIGEDSIKIFNLLLSFNDFMHKDSKTKCELHGGGNIDSHNYEKGELEEDEPSMSLGDGFVKGCSVENSYKTVLNVIMGLFIYDGLKSLKYNNDNNKMLNLLKLLIHLQNKVLSTGKSKNKEQCNLKLLKSIFDNNEIYLQLFNVISINMTNFNFNTLVLKLYNFFLQNYINFNTKNEDDLKSLNNKTKINPELENSVEDKGQQIDKDVGQGVGFETVKPDSHVVANSKIIKMDVLIDEIKFHLDIVYNIIRIYILNSVESTTTLLYLSVFYVEWIKYIKLYYNTLHFTASDIMFIDVNETKEQEVTNTNHDAVFNYSPIDIFKRYIMMILILKELYNIISVNINSYKKNDRKQIKDINETNDYIYESCPLFYNQLDKLYIKNTKIKLGNVINTVDCDVKFFKCLIKNKNEQRNRIILLHDVFFILAKVKRSHTRHNSGLRKMSNSLDESDKEGVNLEITCVHLLWNCIIKKVDKQNNKFNILISWHPKFKTLSPSNRWNENINVMTSEFDVIFNDVNDLNAVLKLHNSNKKNLSNNSLLSLQDYLYN